MADRVYFPNLDGLRFLAAAVVLASHIEELRIFFGLREAGGSLWLSQHQVSLMGELAVTLFFVLSGYLITYLLLIERVRTGKIQVAKFYVRRALRILPLYFFLVSIGLFVLPHIELFDYPVWSEKLNDNFWIKSGLLYAMMPNVLAVLSYPIPYLSHLWSIGVEEQFYLLWPLLMSRVRTTPVLLAAVIFSYLAFAKTSYYLATEEVQASSILVRLSEFLLLTRIDCMAIGGIGAWMLFEKKPAFFKENINPGIAWAVIICTLSMMLFVPQFGAWTHDVYAIVFLALLLVVSVCPPAGFNLEQAWLRYLGKISYGIYMLHFLAIGGVFGLFENYISTSAGGIGKLQTPFDSGLLYACCFMASIVLAAISHRFLEGPFLNLKARFATVGV